MKLNCKLLTCALVMLGLFAASPLIAQSQKWDTSYVPDDTFFSLSVNVTNLVGYEKKDSELRKYIEKGFRETANFDLNELQQVQMFMSGTLQEEESFGHGGEELLAFKFVFSEPQDVKAIVEKMFGEGLEEREQEGKKYWSPVNEYQPSVFSPNDKTMLIAKEKKLTQLMEQSKSMAEVIDRIQSADGNADVFLTFVHNDTTKKIISEIVEELGDSIPFDLEDIASEAKYGSATINLSEGKPLIGNIVAKDEEGAERLQRAVDALLALGKTFMPAAKKELEREVEGFGGAPEGFQEFRKEQQKLGRKALDIVESALEGTSTKTQGNNVEIEVVVMGGVPQTVQVIGGMIQASMRMSESFRAERGGAIDAPKEEAVPEKEIPKEE